MISQGTVGKTTPYHRKLPSTEEQATNKPLPNENGRQRERSNAEVVVGGNRPRHTISKNKFLFGNLKNTFP